MRRMFPFILFFLISACNVGKAQETLAPHPSVESAGHRGKVPAALAAKPYDVRADIDLFLSTESPEVESRVLKRLAQHNISHAEVKRNLRAPPPAKSGLSEVRSRFEIEYNGKKYPYALFVPASSGPEETFPLIVVLHGLGGNGDAIIDKWVRRLRGEFIVLCPSYPMGAWWAQPAQDIVLRLIRNTQSEYPADRNRTFLSGLSNGAIGAFMTGMFYPDYFAGIIPIAGSITKRLMPFLVNLNNTPIYIIHGENDPVFPVANLRRIHKILTDLKYSVVYREHREMGLAHGGHFLPESEVAPLVEWLHRQKRRPHPKTVRMTREGNHMDAIQWARITKGADLAALQIPGPEGEPLNIKGGKIATMFAVLREDNQINVMGKNMLEYEIYLNSEMVDFASPIRITTQEILEMAEELVPGEIQQSFYHKVEKDTSFLLHGFKTRRDPDLLFDAVVRISLENKVARAWKR